MKYLTSKYLVAGIMLAAIASCSKVQHSPGTASLNIVNAVVGSKPLLPIFTDTNPITFFKNTNQLSYGKIDFRNQYMGYSGTQQVVLYQNPDTLKSSRPLFNLTLDLPVGSIRTLFLTGTVNTPDTLFTIDTPPYYMAGDSTAGIRFINLSQGSAPISVNIAGQANGSEADHLAYKGTTAYKDYELGNSQYETRVFEFRDAASGALILSIAPKDYIVSGFAPDIMHWLYRSFTLALVGLPGSTGADAQAILVIPHKLR